MQSVQTGIFEVSAKPSFTLDFQRAMEDWEEEALISRELRAAFLLACDSIRCRAHALLETLCEHS